MIHHSRANNTITNKSNCSVIIQNTEIPALPRHINSSMRYLTETTIHELDTTDNRLFQGQNQVAGPSRPTSGPRNVILSLRTTKNRGQGHHLFWRRVVDQSFWSYFKHVYIVWYCTVFKQHMCDICCFCFRCNDGRLTTMIARCSGGVNCDAEGQTHIEWAEIWATGQERTRCSCWPSIARGVNHVSWVHYTWCTSPPVDTAHRTLPHWLYSIRL